MEEGEIFENYEEPAPAFHVAANPNPHTAAIKMASSAVMHNSVQSDDDFSEDTEDEEYERSVRLMEDPLLFCPCCDKALRDPVELHCGHVMERRCANAARQLGLVLSCPACGARQYCADASQLISAQGGALAKRLPVAPEMRWRSTDAHSSDNQLDKRTKTKVREQRRRRRNKRQRAKERRREQLNQLGEDDEEFEDDSGGGGGAVESSGLVPRKIARTMLKLPDTSVPPPGMLPQFPLSVPPPALAPPAPPGPGAGPQQTMNQMQSMLGTMQSMMLQPGAADNPQLMSMMQQMMQMVQQQQQLDALQRGLTPINAAAAAPLVNGGALSSKASTSTEKSGATATAADPQQAEMELMYRKALQIYQQGNAAPWGDATEMNSMMSQMQAVYSQMYQYQQTPSSMMEAYAAQYSQAMQSMMGAAPPPPPVAPDSAPLSSSASAKAFSELHAAKKELAFPSLGLEIPQFVPQTPRYVEPPSTAKAVAAARPAAAATEEQPPTFQPPEATHLPRKTPLLAAPPKKAALLTAPPGALAPTSTRTVVLKEAPAAPVEAPASPQLADSRHLLLSGLPKGVKAADVKQLCACFGRVNNIKVVLKGSTGGGGDDGQTAMLMAYVTMEAGAAASSAVQRLDLQLFRGAILRAKQLLSNPFVKNVVV